MAPSSTVFFHLQRFYPKSVSHGLALVAWYAREGARAAASVKSKRGEPQLEGHGLRHIRMQREFRQAVTLNFGHLVFSSPQVAARVLQGETLTRIPVPPPSSQNASSSVAQPGQVERKEITYASLADIGAYLGLEADPSRPNCYRAVEQKPSVSNTDAFDQRTSSTADRSGSATTPVPWFEAEIRPSTALWKGPELQSTAVARESASKWPGFYHLVTSQKLASSRADASRPSDPNREETDD
ncbi:unnamed protein product [Jaminaea pallidilutea]